jgi:hypothetical protein
MTIETQAVLMTWNCIGQPPFNRDVIFDTDKGVVAGRLLSIDSNGFHYKFYSDNQAYWGNARPRRWMNYPDSPDKPTHQ